MQCVAAIKVKFSGNQGFFRIFGATVGFRQPASPAGGFHAASITLLLRSWCPEHPYIWRLIVLSWLTRPSRDL